MATITRKGYGQLELNQVAFRRDGRVEAQLPFVGEDGDTCENGMIVAVNKAEGKVEYAGTTLTNKLFGIVYTSEELYDNMKVGLKDFALKMDGTKCVGPDGYNVYPRIGFLSAGDRFTTNAIDFEGATSVAVTKGQFAGVGASGFIALATQAPSEGPVLQVADPDTTMPDGQPAVKFVVISE